MSSLISRIIFLGLFVSYCVAVYLGNPFDANSLLPNCPSLKFFDVHCPACGTNRALHALLHFDIIGAFKQNALFVCLSPFILLFVLFPKTMMYRLLFFVLFVAGALFMIARNVETFSFLAPK